MPYEPTDPLTDPTRQPDELRRLNLEQDRSGGTPWHWMIAAISAIVVAALVYGSTRPISTTATAPTSSPTTTGVAPAAPVTANPLPAPVPSTPAPDNP
jgi:hypothetical protein